MSGSKSGWTRVRFKANKVWLATDADGTPRSKNGKVLIKYQLDQPHEYWVHARNIQPLDDPAAGAAPQTRGHGEAAPVGTFKTRPNKGLAEEAAGKDTIRMYTDGASSGNPGPSGIGVVIQYRDHRKELSRYIGETTNNVAELSAIHLGLRALKTTELPVRIFTDSNYAYGLLALGWKPRRNRELAKAVKQAMSAFKDLQIIKIRGHAGIAENERADYLACEAIKAAELSGSR